VLNSLVERQRDEINSVLSWLDRIVIAGALPDICNARALACYLGNRGLRLFVYAADSLHAAALHRRLDDWTWRFCGLVRHFRNAVPLSFM
jgi:hypothetical protein